jgi:multisubunit Na+/H+ antiporter MnhC subunit
MLTRAVERVADHAKAVLRLETALAAAELKTKLAAVGLGIALLVTGGIFGLFGLGFLLAAAAAALATFLSTWLALLIVALVLLGLATALALVGLGRLKKGTPPVPEQALTEARLTTAALKGSGNGAH